MYFSLARVSGEETILPALLQQGWQFFQLKLKSEAALRGGAVITRISKLAVRLLDQGKAMIRKCESRDFETIYSIINEAAQKYKGIIPEDRWKEPYMGREELEHEIDDGVVFWGYERNGELVGVMGIQHVKDVTLIRHSYTRMKAQGQGIGTELLSFLAKQTSRPILIGTWADAAWAIRFYEKRGFRLVSPELKDPLLKKYWSIPGRQTETSVVLADRKWFDLSGKEAGGA